MRAAIALLSAALVGACDKTTMLPSGPTDFQQLIEVALSGDISDARAGKHKICVDREFDEPLNQTRDQWRITRTMPSEWYVPSTVPGDDVRGKLNPQMQQRLRRAIRDALAGRAQVSRASVISSLPRPLILYSSEQNQPSECDREMPRPLEPPKPSGPEDITLSKPVFVNGFALIEYASSCGGLCYGSYLKAFEKRNGKWTFVASTPLAIG